MDRMRSAATDAMTKQQEAKPRQRIMAELGLSSVVPNVTTVRRYASATFGELDLPASIAVMSEQVAAVRAGALSGLEATLISQAVTLDMIFNEMARRAAADMDNGLNATDTFLRLGLKAQAQCRATLQTLAELKNPQPVAFVKQANIAHGPQQVNNGAPSDRGPSAPLRAGISANASNELWRSTMAHGWTPERKLRQAELIRGWKPWANATGPKTDQGKAASAMNAQRHGMRSQRTLNEARQLRNFIHLCRKATGEG